MRRLLGVAIVVGVVFSGVAWASVLHGSNPQPSPGASEERENESEPAELEAPDTTEDAGVHGGPIERFHRANPCDLTDLSALPGNWTHGDYVAAVAAGGDSALIQQAAHSDCGMPMVAVEHGGGPPAHALANMAAGQAHATGAADHSETEGTAGPPWS
jgi:hypothetical protein